MKSIDTEYKGYKFRSRLEARWAIFFDFLGLEWEYEPEGYQFDDGTKYLPDFYLPELEYWAEVKAKKFNNEEEYKAINLVIETGKPLIKLIGTPSPKTYELITLNEKNWITKDEIVLSNYHNYPKKENRFFSFPSDEDWNSGMFDDTVQAIYKSRGARFEFSDKEVLK